MSDAELSGPIRHGRRQFGAARDDADLHPVFVAKNDGLR
jgi:hypothetical protein